MYPLVLQFIIFLLSVLCYLIIRNNNHLKNIPKPKCSLILGHLTHFKDPTKILKKMTDYAIAYGGTIRIYIPPAKPAVLITDNKVLQQVMTSSDALDKSMNYKFLMPWLGTGLVTSGGYKWKCRRRMLTPCFGRLTLLKHFIDMFNVKGEILVDLLDKQDVLDSIDIFPIVKMYTLDVICETSLGVSMNLQKNHNKIYMRSIEDVCKVAMNRLKSPLTLFDVFHRLTNDYKVQQKALTVINSLFDRILRHKMSKSLEDDKNDEGEEVTFDKQKYKLAFLDLLLQYNSRDNKDNNNFSYEDLKEEVNTITFAGHDTTATGIAFTLYCLSNHPEIQEKVLNEQKVVCGSLNNDTLLTYVHLQEMKYLELVIYESLRLFPPIPAIGRKLTGDITLDNGITLPEGLSVCLFIYGVHHNPKYFKNPEEFLPERFQTDEILPYTFIPFSEGPRNCIGRKFGMLEMKSCISKILRKFELLPDKSGREIKLQSEITLIAVDGINMSLKRRQQ